MSSFMNNNADLNLLFLHEILTVVRVDNSHSSILAKTQNVVLSCYKHFLKVITQ